MKKFLLFLLIGIPYIMWGQNVKVYKISPTVTMTVSTDVYHDVSKPLSEMIEENKFRERRDNVFYKINVENEYHPQLKKSNKLNEPDPLVKIQRAYMASHGTKAEDLILSDSFDGGSDSDNSSSVMPPDTQGDVSPDYYMQAVNNVTTIYDRNGNVLKGPFPTSDFWSGFGNFDQTNDGDAIILWDEDAGRWLVSQFAVPASDGNYYELVAISQTSDPRGAYNRYAFQYSEFNDYPKIAIWPDGYYIGQNAFDSNNNSDGIFASVYERDQMLAGNTARMINFHVANQFSLFPADADDFSNIPSGAPCYFINDQVQTYTNNDSVYIWEFHTDWSNTANSTFSRAQALQVSPYGFFGQTNGDGDAQAEQPGTSVKLDMLHYRTMYRAYYRPFSDHNSLLLCRTVDPANDGQDADQAGIRWYEFRNTGTGAWSVYQQGTYAPGDGKWRWMPSIAMNANGDIAIGYSISDNSSTYPSLAAVARYSTDPLGVMTTNEKILFSGTGSQDVGTNYTRWGDYSMVSVDPNDNYSFWFTSEYTTGGWNWRTRITHFSLPVLNPPSVTGVSPSYLYKDRGKELTITGSDLSGATFDIGGITGTVVSNDGSTAVVDFPPGNYSNGTLTVSNSGGSDNSHSITINTRNTIPVVAGSGVTSDNHPTIQSAVDGLYAWYGNTSFDAGDLPGTKTIVVYAGTYSEEVTLNSNLNPTATNGLIIENNSGDVVTVDASGNDYGFDLSTVDYVTLQGFSVHDANIDNIYAQGDNVTIQYNQTYNAEESGIKIETGSNNTISNNLSYNNKKYGIEVNSANNTIINNTLDGNGYAYSGSETKTYTFSGSVDINDNTNAYADIAVPDNVTITKVRVLDMNITHTYDADLDIYLLHPDGTEVELSTDNGGSGNNYTNTNFDDAASTSITSGTAPFTGTYKPEGNLSDFNGKNSNGTWRLRVFDDANGDQGTITSWTLEITYNVNIEQGAGLYVGNVAANVKNNIIVAKSGNDNFYALQSPGNSVTSNYNVYYTTNTNAFDYNGTQDNTGPMSANDLLQDPVFVGSGDYHIQSQAGSYHSGEWPPTTATAGTWTNDASNSPALDGGDPADPYANEPQSGNRINIGAYGNTVQASKSNSVIISWNGSVSSDWQTTGNWDGGSIPTSAEDVLIPNGCPNYPVIDDGISTVAECNNITIENSASLTIAPNGYMTIGGSITNNAGTGGITIQSDATGTGSLIQNSTTGVDATVQRFFASSGRSWHFLTAPISNADIATVFPNTSYLYYYDESTDDYWTGNNYDAGSTMGWTNITSGTMDPKKGYLWNYFQNTLNFAGSLNTSTAGQNITINYTDHGSNAPNGTTYDNYDGWNFVANPFTSAIDWTVVDAHAANLYDAIYVWDGANATYKSWVNGTDSWDGASTNGGSQYIPAMQGFFVKVDENLGTSGTLNIPANARVHNTQTFWKKGTPNNFMRLSVKANGFTDETVVRLLVGATSGMDDHMDAFKLFSYVQAAPQIYTVDDDKTEYSINSLPETKDIRVIPLKIYTNADKFVLSIPEFNFKDYNVFLIDNNEISSNEMELAEGQSYKFSTDGNEQNGRFELIISPKENTTSLAAVSNSVTIYPNPTTGDFYVRMPHNEDYYKVIITTESGKVVYSNEMSGDDYYRISLAGYPAGMYMIKVIKDSGVVHFEKIILK